MLNYKIKKILLIILILGLFALKVNADKEDVYCNENMIQLEW